MREICRNRHFGRCQERTVRCHAFLGQVTQPSLAWLTYATFQHTYIFPNVSTHVNLAWRFNIRQNSRWTFKIFFRTPDEKAPQDARAPAAPSSKAPTTPAISPRRPGRPPLPLKRKMNGPTSPRKKGYKHVRKDQTKSVTVTRDRSTVHEKQQTVEEVEQVLETCLTENARISLLLKMPEEVVVMIAFVITKEKKHIVCLLLVWNLFVSS